MADFVGTSPLVDVTGIYRAGYSNPDFPAELLPVFIAAGASAPAAVTFETPVGALTVTTPIIVRVTGDGIVQTIISVEYSTPDRHETAFRGLDTLNEYDSDYDVASTVDTNSDGYTYSVVPDSGWRGNFTMHVTAINDGGFVTTVSTAYTVAGSSAPVLVDVDPPTGSTLGLTDTITFRASDTGGLQVADVWIEFPADFKQHVWDGTEFAEPYRNSTHTVIDPGRTFEFVLRRDLGWYDSLVVMVRLVDTDGITVTEALSYTLTSTSTPEVTEVFPAEGSELNTTDAVSFMLSYGSAHFRLITVTVTYQNYGTEVAYTGFAFTPQFADSTTAGTTTRTFDIVRVDGWRESFTLDITAVDEDGHILEDSLAYTVEGGGPIGGANAPIVGPFNPPSGTPITSETSISFPVTDDSGETALIAITAFFARTGAWEVVWLKDRYAPYYAGSTRAMITNGHMYTVERTFQGWTSSPRFIVEVVDKTGLTN